MNDPHQNTPGKKVGQGMWVLFWCLLLAALVFYFSAREEQQTYPNQHIANSNSGGSEILLQANRYGHYTLTGKINGMVMPFLIDTGATEVVIPGHLAKDLGLTEGRKHSVNTANGIISVYSTKINTLELGPIQLRNVRASINPHMDGDILLGMSALSSLDMSQSNNQMVLRQR